MTEAAVFVEEHKVWALVKGKQYADGRFKYLYNGREALATPYQAIPAREGLDRKRLKEEVVRLNLQNIERNRPKKKKLKARWAPDMDELLRIEEIIQQQPEPPVVAAEEQ